MSAEPVPSAIELYPDRLRLCWPDADVQLDAVTLRAACRCAGCRAAQQSGAASVGGKPVQLRDAVPVGRYALQLCFSDGHERGIYPWAMLRQLQREG